MAGDWIMVRCDLRDDPAVIHVSEALKMDPDLVVGKLVRLWIWANQQLRFGDAHNVTGSWLDRHVDAHGMSKQLVKVGWLEITSEGVRFPNFDRWNSKSAKARGLHRLRSERYRDAHNVTRAPIEKRREEKKRSPYVYPPSTLERIYKAYPSARRVGKRAALPKIQQALKEIASRPDAPDDPAAWLLERVEKYARAVEGKEPSKFIPHPTTWMNQGRYDDDESTWTAAWETGSGRQARPGQVRRGAGDADLYDSTTRRVRAAVDPPKPDDQAPGAAPP